MIGVIGQTIPIQLQRVDRKVILDKRRIHLNHCLFSVVPDVLRVENLFKMENCEKRKRVVMSTELRLDDDGDDIVENTTSLISHTNGMKALKAALCYVEQQASASHVMLIKNGETMRQVAELLGFNKKCLLIVLMVCNL
ncbi:hypothetical protein AVEN_81631-1 [Araneus ventricosus]|uniref:Uncharacterized protein n=1 Tax=Araneus ventricosus TaxID=182803 RepID=A0A4Y2HF36_ARAVE|nr:hypothetical protein AVEN_81631-1 [Araneus ventricosus]